MSNRISRFVKALFGFDKQYTVETRSIPELNESSNNTNNQDNMDLVRRGHYCSKATLNAEVKDIIRVLGPCKDKPGYYITQEGREISGYELDNYVCLDTVPDGTKVNIDKKRGIMGDFAPVRIEDVSNNKAPKRKPTSTTKRIHATPQPESELIITEEPVAESESVIEQPVNEPQHFDDYDDEPQLSPEEIRLNEIKDLIEKASIEKLNDYSDKKLGIRPYKPKKITLTLDIEIPYEIKKLAQLAELFEIEYRDISNIILQNLDIPKEIIQHKIENFLRGAEVPDGDDKPSYQPEVPQYVAPPIQHNPVIESVIPSENPDKVKPVEYQENIETLDNGIADIDSFLDDFFSKK